MKTYKQIDLWLQILLIAGGTVYSLTVTDGIFYAYFTVGGIQLLSCFIHFLCADYFLPVKERRAYLKTLFWVFILGIISIPVWLFFWFAMLIVSPVLALWYTAVCHWELNLIKEKELVHLK